MRRHIIGVMGAGKGASEFDLSAAERLGELIAQQGWILLTGGRPSGVMEAASRGAKRVEGSITVGILPGVSGASEFVDIPIYTGMGNARNAINVLSCDIVIAVGATGAGTASEIALAIKSGKPVVLLHPSAEAEAYFRSLSTGLYVTTSFEEAIDVVVESHDILNG